MPNEVYATAHRELLAMVSPRAAERMLNDALSSVGVTPEAVTARQMRALITGRIQYDLRTIIPSSGSNRVLRTIMEVLRAMSPTTDPDVRTSKASAADMAEPKQGAPRATPPAALATAVAEPRPETRTVPAPLADYEASRDELEHIALTFARLEHVTGVTVVQDGKAVFARGTGLDPERAAGIVPIAAKLLARRGAWRSYTLVHDRGQCLIIPVGRDFIVLVGRSEFNLGAVLTVLATLEEDL